MPMDTCAVIFELVNDSNINSVSPTKLKPRARETVVEDLGFRKDHAIRIDSSISQHKCVVPRNTSWTVEFVVSIDVVCPPICILKPAASVTGACAGVPSRHTAIVTGET